MGLVRYVRQCVGVVPQLVWLVRNKSAGPQSAGPCWPGRRVVPRVPWGFVLRARAQPAWRKPRVHRRPGVRGLRHRFSSRVFRSGKTGLSWTATGTLLALHVSLATARNVSIDKMECRAGALGVKLVELPSRGSSVFFEHSRILVAPVPFGEGHGRKLAAWSPVYNRRVTLRGCGCITSRAADERLNII